MTDVPDVWDGLRKLDEIIRINQNIKENIITITVDYYDPEMAAKDGRVFPHRIDGPHEQRSQTRGYN